MSSLWQYSHQRLLKEGRTHFGSQCHRECHFLVREAAGMAGPMETGGCSRTPYMAMGPGSRERPGCNPQRATPNDRVLLGGLHLPEVSNIPQHFHQLIPSVQTWIVLLVLHSNHDLNYSLDSLPDPRCSKYKKENDSDRF